MADIGKIKGSHSTTRPHKIEVLRDEHGRMAMRPWAEGVTPPMTDEEREEIRVRWAAFEHQRNLARAIGYNLNPGEDVDLCEEMRSLEKDARNGIGYMEHVAPGGEVRAVTKKFAGSMRSIDIRTTRMPSQLRAAEYVSYATHRAAAETNRLSTNIITDSLVSQAGARVIITEPRPAPIVGDIIATYKDAGMFRLVESAKFAYVADDDDVADSANPFFDLLIGMDESFSYAFRTKITRRQSMSIGGASTIDALTGAITKGLANLADSVLLAEILAKTPTAFSLAKAAARGVYFHELRALVGTAGTGAVVENGRLRVSGIGAELTSASAQTVVGAFNRAAVAIAPVVNIYLERLNVNGDMYMTCWANMKPLVPDATAFWTAGA